MAQGATRSEAVHSSPMMTANTAVAAGAPVGGATADAATTARPAPVKPALKGLPIASRVAVVTAEMSSAAPKEAPPVVGSSTCGGLSIRKRTVNIEAPVREAEVCAGPTVTTPLARRGTRRRSGRTVSITQAGRSPTHLDCCLTPASGATTATQCSFARKAGRSDTTSTNSSVRWAPQALCRAWHGRLTEVYKIITIVGEGRSGAVFVVQHKASEKYYACKMLKKSCHDVEVLKREIQTLRKLDHPNIVRLVETHEDDDTVYLLMELCHGGDLFDKIMDEQMISECTARLFAKQMISALAYCHANGVIHRDVKPENFLLETDQLDCLTLKLADFGIATSVRPPHLAMGDPTPAHIDGCARNGGGTTSVGSLPYMAPETLRGKRAVAASDMWSVGVTICVMLSGSLPFDDVPDRICSGELPDFTSETWSNISEDAINLIRRLLKQDPEERLTAQQALAHAWFSEVTPLGEATPDLAASFGDLMNDHACLHRLALHLLRTLRRWRKMPKLRRIAIAAIAKRVEAQHDAHRLAETAYTFFSDAPETLRCERLAQSLSQVLGGAALEPFGALAAASQTMPAPATPPTLLPGMVLSPKAAAGTPTPQARASARSGHSTSVTGLRVRERLRNSLRRLAGTPKTAEDARTPMAEASLAELRYLIAALDGMKNGTVDFTLLVAALLPPEVYTDRQQVAEVFGLFDVQHRGRVSAGDVRAAVKSQDCDIRKFAAMVAEFDVNTDGALDFAEFYAMVAGPSVQQRHGSNESMRSHVDTEGGR